MPQRHTVSLWGRRISAQPSRLAVDTVNHHGGIALIEYEQLIPKPRSFRVPAHEFASFCLGQGFAFRCAIRCV